MPATRARRSKSPARKPASPKPRGRSPSATAVAAAKAKANTAARRARSKSPAAASKPKRAPRSRTTEAPGEHKRPRGRAPKGKVWDAVNGVWVDDTDAGADAAAAPKPEPKPMPKPKPAAPKRVRSKSPAPAPAPRRRTAARSKSPVRRKAASPTTTAVAKAAAKAQARAAAASNSESSESSGSTRAEELAKARAQLTLLKRPLDTLAAFGACATQWAKRTTQEVVSHKYTQQLLVPTIALYLAGRVLATEGSAVDSAVKLTENWFHLVLFWTGLGIASSVGLGTGLHSGMLFVFPHTYAVVKAAEACGHVDFDTHHYYGDRQCDALPECQEGYAGDTPCAPVPFWSICAALAPVYFLWGSGTAIGEIPPYALSKTAAEAGKKNAEFDDIMNERSRFDVFNRMKDWMVDFLQRRGFIGVLLMAAWPNAAFDLCGICCGHFRMPFWTFFGATWIGKALLKANFQLMGFVTLFSAVYFNPFVANYLQPAATFATNLAGISPIDVAEFGRVKAENFSPATTALKQFLHDAAMDFGALDTDGDGALSAAEFNGVFAAPGRSFESFTQPPSQLGKYVDSPDALFAKLDKGRDGALQLSDVTEAASLPKQLFGYMLICFLVFFGISCVEQLAQMHQADVDEKELEEAGVATE